MAAIADPPIAAKAAPTINMLALDSFSDQPGDEGAADQQHLSDKLRGIGKENKVNIGGPHPAPRRVGISLSAAETRSGWPRRWRW